MSTPDILDFPKLLAPISGDQPAGVDLRADASPGSAYYAVRDVRLANRAAERQLLADPGTAAAPDWRPVLQRGQAVLAEKAKDLEIVAYVIEALVRLHGFAGLRDGFRLARELIERFWEGLYPLPDEDGLETRLAPLIGLNGQNAEGTLISPILCVPLTHEGNGGPFACYHVQQALALSQVTDENVRDARLQEGTVSLEVIGQAVWETSRDFYALLVHDLTQCEDEFAKLCQVLEEKSGAHAPPTSNIRSALAACRDALNQVAEAKLPAPEPEQAPAGERTATNSLAAAGSPVPTHAAVPPTFAGETAAEAVANRDHAFRLLLKVAEYFRRAEPQSVVSYGLEQVVRWGKMALPDLLSELIADRSPREQLFKQVGIRSARVAAFAEDESPPDGPSEADED
jgi:type VI secretion system protein ImpA